MTYAQTREWRKRNPEGKRAQDARYRARHREALKEKARTLNQKPERREYQRQWELENLDKVREQQRDRYREDSSRREYQREHGRAWRAENADYCRELQRAWREDRKLIVTPNAVNNRQPWTEAELRVALNRSLTLTEAALMLGRTVHAISNQRHKRRVAS